MAASLNLFYSMAQQEPATHKDLCPSFVSILKQIIENRLPREFDYHKVCVCVFLRFSVGFMCLCACACAL